MNYKIKSVLSGKDLAIFQYEKPIYVGYKSNRVNYEKQDKGIKSDKSLERTKTNLKSIINCNVSYFSKFITFTYEKTCLHRYKILYDFGNFKKRFKEKYGEGLKYVAVLEHQKERGIKEGNEGSYHLHVVCFNDFKINYMELKEMWKQGSVDLKKIDYVENIGLYLMKYITKESIDLNKKSIFKSKGLKTPQIARSDTELFTRPQKPKYATYYTIQRQYTNKTTGEFKKYDNSVIYKEYRLKREKKQ